MHINHAGGVYMQTLAAKQIIMSKQEKYDKLIEVLDKLDDEFIQSSMRILNAGNGNMYTIDLLSSAVNNRALQLTKGFLVLAKENNFISAIPLIRLQLDNALRFFATTLVSNYNDFFLHYLGGKPIRDYKDAKGQKLTDNYLAKTLDVHFPGALKLYNDTSGHIHLSDRHFFATTAKVNDEDRTIQMAVGPAINNFTEHDKMDFVTTMIEVSKLVIIVVEQWRHHKDAISGVLPSR